MVARSGEAGHFAVGQRVTARFAASSARVLDAGE
jgi:hypothetical protein